LLPHLSETTPGVTLSSRTSTPSQEDAIEKGVRRGTEFENLDEGHRFALALTDLVAGGPDHDGGHGMRTRLRNDHPADALPAGPASTLLAVTKSGGDTYLVAIALGSQVTPIPVTLDGQTHTMTISLEQAACTLAPGHSACRPPWMPSQSQLSSRSGRRSS
jgi:hypothetical protein